MHSETAPVNFSLRGEHVGLHNGSLEGIEYHIPQGALTINGYSPHDRNQWDDLIGSTRGAGPVVWEANSGLGDETDRHLVTIARGIGEHGNNPYKGMPALPPDRYEGAANHLTNLHGLKSPTDYQTPPTAPVSNEMTTAVQSNWRVVSLGELQQPGGVGGTQPYNPIVDGPNPDAPPNIDNAQNSPEQEVGLQRWVNAALHLLNRGETPEVTIAHLAEEGCPNPDEIVQRALQQPEEVSPVSDELGQDPFEVPPTEDPSTSGEMQGLSQQPPVMAATGKPGSYTVGCSSCGGEFKSDKKTGFSHCEDHKGMRDYDKDWGKASKRVRIAGTSMEGVEISRWEGLWGETTVKVALDGGGTLDVAPEAVQELTGASKPHPVTEIQTFIDSIPEVQPTRPSIEARLANLELVRRAVRANISKVGFHDQVKLEGFDSDAQNEQIALNAALKSAGQPGDDKYLAGLRGYEFNKFATATPQIFPYSGNVKEAAIIWAVESPYTKGTNTDDFHFAAAHYATQIGLSGGQINEFLAAADDHRIVRTEEFTAEPETIDSEGPAEALLL